MNSQAAAPFQYLQGVPATAGWAARAEHAARRVLASIRYRRQVRRNIAVLSSLDDKMLADVGISRDQLRYVARLGHVPGQS